MAHVTIYTTRPCPYCIAARELLGRLGVDYEDIDVGADAALRAEMERRAGRRTVPQIWIESFKRRLSRMPLRAPWLWSGIKERFCIAKHTAIVCWFPPKNR